MSMAQIRFVAWLIILALSAGAADTNSTGTVDASPNMSWGEKQTTAVNLRHPNYCCQCNPYEGPVDCPDADNSGKPCC